MEDSEGYGKAPRVRKHQNHSKSPYARPTRPSGNPTSETPLLENKAPYETERSSLFGSVFSAAKTPLRAAVDLINKVPLLGSYFNPSSADKQTVNATITGASPRASGGIPRAPFHGLEPDGDDLVDHHAGPSHPDSHSPYKPQRKPIQTNTSSPIIGRAPRSDPIQLIPPLPISPSRAAKTIEDNTQSETQQQRFLKQALETRIDGTTVAGTSSPDAGTPPAMSAEKEEEGEKETPYDSILGMLRNGPLAKDTPLPFPKPGSRTAERNAAIRRIQYTPPRAPLAGNQTHISEDAAVPLQGQLDSAAGIDTGDKQTLTVVHQNPIFIPAPAGHVATPTTDTALPVEEQQHPVPGTTAAATVTTATTGGRRVAFGQKTYAGSRLGPFGASALRPSTAPRPSTAFPFGSGASRFARADRRSDGVGMQQQRQRHQDGGDQYFHGFGSPATFAWTPMNATTPLRDATPGNKRKAEHIISREEEEEERIGGGEKNKGQRIPTTLGSISILDARRSIRQRSEPATFSAERRSWRAGRTPYNNRPSQIPRLFNHGERVSTPFVHAAGATPPVIGGRPTHLTPMPLVGMQMSTPVGGGMHATTTRLGRGSGSGIPQPPSLAATTAVFTTTTTSTPGSKPTTDTARKILETLDQLDEAIRPRGRGTSSPHEGTAAPPPMDSLGGNLPTSSPAAATPSSSSPPLVSALPISSGGPVGAMPGGKRDKTEQGRVTFASLTGTAIGIGTAIGTGTGGDHSSIPWPSPSPEPSPTTGIFGAGTTSKHSQPSASPPLQIEEREKKGIEAAAPGGLFSFGAAPSSKKEEEDKKSDEKGEKVVYTFGTSVQKESLERKKAIADVVNVVKAQPSSSEFVVPVYSFGKEKKIEEKKGGGSGFAVSKPFFAFAAPPTKENDVGSLVAANRVAQEAAKSPLPVIESEEEEEEVEEEDQEEAEDQEVIEIEDQEEEDEEVVEIEDQEKEKEKATSGGWDLNFLQKNKSVAQQATEAAAKEIEDKGFGTSTTTTTTTTTYNNVPAAFSFGTSTTPITGFTFGGAVPASSTPSFIEKSSAVPASSDAFPEPSSIPAFLLPSSTAAATTTTTTTPAPVVGGSASAPLFSFGAAAPITVSRPEDEEGAAAAAAVPPPVFSFGAAPLEEKKEIPQPAATTTTATLTTATTTPPALSGWGDTFLKANQQAASTAADAAAKDVENAGGCIPTAPGSAAAPAPVFSFGVPSTTAATTSALPAASTPLPSTPGFTFGSDARSTAPAMTQQQTPTFNFGATTTPTPTPATATTTTTAPAPAFVFGSQPTTQAITSTDAAPTTTPPPFGFGSSQTAVTTTQPTPAASAVPNTSTGFTFGAPTAPGTSVTAVPAPAPSSFAFGAQPSASASSLFTEKAGAFTNTGAAPPGSNTFAFGSGAPSSSVGAGVAPAAAVTKPPVFGSFGAPPSTTAPGSNTFGFGSAPQQPPAFGAPPSTTAPGSNTFGFGSAPQQPPAFGSASGGFGAAITSQPFGAPQQQANAFGFGASAANALPQAFGSQQPAPGQMIPNNPFGAMPPGGFQMGSSGNSQSEGRRKLKVRRPGRK